MKKISILMVLVFAMFSSQAQMGDESKKEAFKSKRGVYILPEAGDIALGFDAAPFFGYLGDMFNGTANNGINTDFIRRQAIAGKYFLDENTAVRAELRIGINNTKNQEFVAESGTDLAQNVFVTDKQIRKQTDLHLSAGYEMRRGYGRVQGYFGGMGGVGYTKTNISYEYGNPITAVYTNPAANNYGNNLTGRGRITEVNNLTDLTFGVRGFIGVEYFFAPKISIGAEFGWGPSFSVTADGNTTEEFWTGTELKTQTTDVARDTQFRLDTDNAMGNIFLLFHF